MRRATLRRTRTGYICIADHVLLWCPACAICEVPVSTPARAMKAARQQSGVEQKVWLEMALGGVGLDSGQRWRWYGRVCAGCVDERPTP